jgi:hypothetical protein
MSASRRPARPLRMLAAAFLFVSPAVVASACQEDGLVQGEGFAPSATLATGPGQPRPPPCEGGECAVEAATPIPESGPDVGGIAPINTCATAKVLGAVSGDTAANVITATGSCSEWLRVRVTENDTGVGGSAQQVRITLTPTGQDYDLLAYVDTANDVLSCINPTLRSEKTGTAVDEVTLSWGEGATGNNADDSRDVSILVVAKEPCAGGSSWSLSVRGNP